MYILRERYPYDGEMLDGILDILTEVYLSKKAEMVVGGDTYPTKLVQERFSQLTSSHIEYVMGCLAENTTKVRNVKKYMLATLFNAPTTMKYYYQAEVNHDWPQYVSK